MSKKLLDFRKKIDALDNKIHEALLQRVEIVEKIAELKRSESLDFVQPSREAQMIRRVLSQHKSTLPQAAIVRIWRELVGAMSMKQTGLKVAVCLENDNIKIWDYARSYFGSVVPMQKVSDPIMAIASVREDDVSFAVLPWPHDYEGQSWWAHLLCQESDIRIVGALPYGNIKGELSDPDNKAVIISKVKFEPSGEDHSFIALDIDQNVSRGRIVDALKELGFEPLGITSDLQRGAQGNSVHLVEVNDYLDAGDDRLARLAEKFDEQFARCAVLGGYPVPPVYTDA